MEAPTKSQRAQRLRREKTNGGPVNETKFGIREWFKVTIEREDQRSQQNLGPEDSVRDSSSK
jgi:hypothetical protein